jgi:hypothetical protein
MFKGHGRERTGEMAAQKKTDDPFGEADDFVVVDSV